MRRYRRAIALLGLLASVLGPAHAAAAGEATDQIRADLEALSRAVRSPGAQPAGQAPASSRAIADRMFDWPAMAEAALQRHWKGRTPAERAEFTRLFSDLFSRAYLSRIHLVDAGRFEYLGDTAAGDRRMVKTKVFTKRGTAIAVDYMVWQTSARRWQVHDVRVETISLLDNYRVQFDAIVTRSSYADLVARLRTATQ
jgi:phospholipid transport system substrate-binding protein